MDADVKELFSVVLSEQANTYRAITVLTENVDKYVAAADARMKRIEDNLDGLIRAITREHSNGKGQV